MVDTLHNPLPQYTPLVPRYRLLELIRGYIANRSDYHTHPDMNSEKHLLALCELVCDEAQARIPLWELERGSMRE